MYRELDNLLSEESTVDSWYDDGFLIAQSIMNDFQRMIGKSFLMIY